MAEGTDTRFPIEVTRKWLDLAERRKAYLIDLYETGRWRLFYSEAEFIKRLREAVDVVERWSVTEQTSLDGATPGPADDLVASDVTADEPVVPAESA